MDTITFPAAILVLGSLTLLSLADLRDRALPGIWIFFVAGVLFGLVWGGTGSVVKVGAVLLAVWWGMAFADANLRLRFPIFLIIPALFCPTAWPVILTGAGTRRTLIARGDLLAIGGIACLFEGYAPLFALLGVLFWRRFWRRNQSGAVPALPGMLLGILGALGWSIFHSGNGAIITPYG